MAVYTAIDNPALYFNTVLYTGNGTDDTDISHNLSAVPHLMIQKGRTDAYSWITYHHKNTDAPETDHLTIESTAATADSAYEWNDTSPTSSVWTVGSGSGSNQDTKLYVAYLWSEKQGFSKFGSYTGNGDNDGVFVYTGFSPAWVLIKKSGASGTSWVMFDNKRNTYNERSIILQANDTGAEETSTNRIDFCSNGFKLRGTWTVINNSGDTYIYMAFEDAPFVISNGVPSTAR